MLLAFIFFSPLRSTSVASRAGICETALLTYYESRAFVMQQIEVSQSMDVLWPGKK